MRKPSVLVLVLVPLVVVGAGVLLFSRSVPESADGVPEVLRIEVVARLPHDPDAFTQGLLIHDGLFYESTGLYGRSSLRIVDPATGRVLQRVDVPAEYFAEGLALHDGVLIQLTWREQTAFVYDPATLERVGTLRYAGEGWGLASNGSELFLTDGSSGIRVVDGRLRTRRVIEVRDAGEPVGDLNEIEWYKGTILANVWQRERIARIDPETGDVVAWIDCSGLRPRRPGGSGEDVMNGIAYDPAGDRLYLTGKLWPHVYEVRILAGE